MGNFSIVNNVEALNVHRSLGNTQNRLTKVMERLSTGLRINRAADDGAGFAISEKLRGQTRGLSQASRNAQDGISVIQTAEGALGETESILQRLRELSVQAANDTLVAADRSKIQTEVDQLLAEIDRFANTTEFNTKKLLDGTLGTTALTLQVGANQNQTISFTVTTATASGLGVSGIGVTTHSLATSAIVSLDAAISTMANERAKLGAMQNRLEHTIQNLESSRENLSASESRIRDADIAKETMELTRLQILQQAGVAAQAQANALPQAVLSLLRG
jgi:flagellin